MKKFIILGKNSLVGKSLFDFLEGKEERELISKEQLNFLEPHTFKNIDFNNTLIVDCINVNNGNEEAITKCNYTGFGNFIDYLKKNAANFTYIYISTSSVLLKESVEQSAYVRSKKRAEDLLINSGLNYQIVRLSYPIGKDENKQRLITRLISNLKEDKDIQINNVLINLNAVEDVVKDMYSKFFQSATEFISNNIYLHLGDLVLFLKKETGSKSELSILPISENFTPMSDKPFIPSRDIKEVLSSML